MLFCRFLIVITHLGERRAFVTNDTLMTRQTGCIIPAYSFLISPQSKLGDFVLSLKSEQLFQTEWRMICSVEEKARKKNLP